MNTEKIQEEGPALEQLDHDGNVVLVVQGQPPCPNRRFLVSSKVLSLASVVFQKLFAPKFLEGKHMANNKCTEIILHDDDPATMSTLLALLHYQGPKEAVTMESKRLAALSIHCDKYNCFEAFRPWITYWFHQIESSPSVEEYGLLLLAAHFFRASDVFSEYSLKAQLSLEPEFASVWDKLESLSMLPEDIKCEYPSFCALPIFLRSLGDLTDRINNLLDTIHNELQSVEGSLRRNQKGYMTQGLICMHCGRTHPISAKKCHSCRNVELQSKYCTSDTRVGELFTILRRAELWPSVTPFKTRSASDLFLLISRAKADSRHACAAGTSCPLESELGMLVIRVEVILSQISGLELYPLHRGSFGTQDEIDTS